MVKNGNICYNEFNNQKYKGSLKMSDRVFNTLEEKLLIEKVLHLIHLKMKFTE